MSSNVRPQQNIRSAGEVNATKQVVEQGDGEGCSPVHDAAQIDVVLVLVGNSLAPYHTSPSRNGEARLGVPHRPGLFWTNGHCDNFLMAPKRLRRKSETEPGPTKLTKNTCLEIPNISKPYFKQSPSPYF